MKKIIYFLLCFTFIFSFSACSSKPDGMSQEVYDYGRAALQLTDDFFDGKMTFKKFSEDSENQFNSFCNFLDKVSADTDKNNLDGETEKLKNKINNTVVDLIYYNPLWHESRVENPNYEFAVEHHIRYRNEMAVTFKEAEREFDIQKILSYINK